jgi:hypothetical protein
VWSYLTAYPASAGLTNGPSGNSIIVTDTATYRYPDYHSYADTYDKINFDKFTKTVSSLINVIEDLVK